MGIVAVESIKGLSAKVQVVWQEIPPNIGQNRGFRLPTNPVDKAVYKLGETP
jgi:hypothetical protein